ncbi:hypothetical protein JOC54_002871 [Alkalihalobacillus xiaoxiensis]|uniref:Holin n=1 Tax=Shouchella xiaoxiensis TaxID=766895 RepID=A0ABS2SX50_9BACI|nr:hypothetical protein [Shouchella xiaoxiensis]
MTSVEWFKAGMAFGVSVFISVVSILEDKGE